MDGQLPSEPPRETVVETPTEARQATTSGRMRYVLAIGIAAVVIAFAIIYMTFVVVI